MHTHTLSRLLIVAVLIAGPGVTLMPNPALAASEAQGSALPPGINPSSPAGGNGGDAQGYDKKPAASGAASGEKKATTPPSSSHPASSSTHEPKTSVTHKKATVKKQ